MQVTTVSRDLWGRAVESLPGGNTRTTIFDVDSVERIDFVNNYTSLVLGHCRPRAVEAVQHSPRGS